MREYDSASFSLHITPDYVTKFRNAVEVGNARNSVADRRLIGLIINELGVEGVRMMDSRVVSLIIRLLRPNKK